jgi:hypothetical protein
MDGLCFVCAILVQPSHFYLYVLTDFLSILVSIQIREILNLPDLTPEEEAQAREEHRWIFEDSGN